MVWVSWFTTLDKLIRSISIIVLELAQFQGLQDSRYTITLHVYICFWSLPGVIKFNYVLLRDLGFVASYFRQS